MLEVHRAAGQFVRDFAPLIADPGLRWSIVEGTLEGGEATYAFEVLVDALVERSIPVPAEALALVEQALSNEPDHMYPRVRAAAVRARARATA
ncbi:hypothetical protein [Nocardioides sp.]|uniref:hypothetical protein n=1 Tax=Nocardioides sp. TaxID=35761 RepID=UPI0039E2CCEF